MTTYQPTGTGLCAECGHDVRRHDGGHKMWGELACCSPGCGLPPSDPIHDVGRELRCPKEAAMTDLRKLAERIVDKMLDDIRDHELVSEGECACMWESSVDEIITALTRILREELEGGAAESSGVAADTEVPAPDRPYEYIGHHANIGCPKCGAGKLLETTKIGCSECGAEWTLPKPQGKHVLLPNPIHQTNEVSDEPDAPQGARREARDRQGVLEEPSAPARRDSGEVHEEAHGEEGATRRQAEAPQVTNYDAEAEAQAREGVWVTAGDEVRLAVDSYAKGEVVGIYDGEIVAMWDGHGLDLDDPSDLRTPTGQPVLGFREREAPLDGDRLVRIAALERERDEARAERDELLHAMPKSVMRRIKAQGWVRLDNETIALWERVLMHDSGGMGTVSVIHTCTRLADLRDGKLGGGE